MMPEAPLTSPHVREGTPMLLPDEAHSALQMAAGMQ